MIFESAKSHSLAGIVIVTTLLAAAFLSLSTGGRPDVGPAEVVQFFSGHQVSPAIQSTLVDIRAPRTVLAALLGMNLALAGVLLQAITRNSLASPSILGINQGAALGLVLALLLPEALGLLSGVMAIIGGLGAGTLTFSIAGGLTGRINQMRLVLGGLAVGAFGYAAVRFAYTFEDDLARSVVSWTTGNISNMRWPDVTTLLIWSGPAWFAVLFMAHRLNLIALGDGVAQGLGADPRITLLLGAIAAAVLTGASVMVAGPIAFVGLIIPHIARRFFGSDHRVLVPTSALMGAALLVMADGVGRLGIFTTEVPVGIIAALIGAPYFLFLTLFSETID